MKKILSLLLVLTLVFSLAACGDKGDDVTGMSATIKAGEKLTHDELVEKAKAETGTFSVYGTSSRIKNAGEGFSAKYDIAVEATNVKDSEIYTKIDAEIEGNVAGADMILTQNGPEVLDRLESGTLLNFIPSSIKDKVDPSDLNPLVHQYINKLFIYNNVDGQTSIKNVWELTESKYKGKIFFKSPEGEQVNMNFLIMLTSPTWSEKLANAYKLYAGNDVELGTYKNAGYKWVAEFIANCSFAITSDTKMAEEISNKEAGDKMGLFVFSKLRSSSVTSENLSVVAFEEEALPFAGFMYPLYAQIMKNADRPYTAMLFVEYLMEAEGFAPWGKDVGAYSGNNELPVNESLGDRELAFWKKSLVMEDPEYIGKAYAEVYDFISVLLS